MNSLAQENSLRIMGIDPGLQNTGWGIIDVIGNKLSFIACGTVKKKSGNSLPESLGLIDKSLNEIIETWKPDSVAIEETFVNCNPSSTLILGQARGAAITCMARNELFAYEYATNLIKKSVVGKGHADKKQIQMMVKVLLPIAEISSPDEADALAVAICHAHHMQTARKI